MRRPSSRAVSARYLAYHYHSREALHHMTTETAPRGHRHITRAAIAVLALVAVAGCSSDATKSDASSKKKTTSTTLNVGSNPTPPCTVGAATAALTAVSATANTIVCKNGWAAGSASTPGFDMAYMLMENASGNKWTNMATDAGNGGAIRSSASAMRVRSSSVIAAQYRSG